MLVGSLGGALRPRRRGSRADRGSKAHRGTLSTVNGRSPLPGVGARNALPKKGINEDQMRDRRGGGEGGGADRTEGCASVSVKRAGGGQSGDHAAGGATGRTAPPLTHSVPNPWHCQAARTEPQRTPPLLPADCFAGRSED